LLSDATRAPRLALFNAPPLEVEKGGGKETSRGAVAFIRGIEYLF
jgi:hypothetical protein